MGGVITGILGPPRTGKSTFACILAEDALKHSGMDVAANFPMPGLPGVGYFETFDDLKKLHNTVAFVDEFPTWFGRRDHAKTGDAELSQFRQGGKMGIILYWIAHGLQDAETKVAETLTQEVWKVKRLFGPDRWGKPSQLEDLIGCWAVACLYDVELVDTPTKRVCKDRKFYRLDKHWHKFDSAHIVGSRSGQGTRRGLARQLAPQPGTALAASLPVRDVAKFSDGSPMTAAVLDTIRNTSRIERFDGSIVEYVSDQSRMKRVVDEVLGGDSDWAMQFGENV